MVCHDTTKIISKIYITEKLLSEIGIALVTAGNPYYLLIEDGE